MSLTNIDSYSVSHNKNGGGGTTTIYNGNKQSSNFNSIHTRNINATQGSISYLQTKSISANDANIMYITTKEGKILKIDGEQLSYKSGYIGDLSIDTAYAKKLSVDDIDALKAWIGTLNSKEITTEKLTVTKQAHFFELIIDKIRSVGGQLILTPASCQIDYVKGYGANDVEITDLSSPNIAYYNVYWRNEDEETERTISNDFKVNDQVICQSFNARTGTNNNVSNKYYWRLVEGILPDIYVNLSTGAMTNTQSQTTDNQFEISMLNTKIGPEIYNEIQWNVQPQSNVSWSDVADTNYAANGLMTTASQVYGIKITPITSVDTTLPITSELDFIIKQLSIGNTYNIPENINIGVYFADDTFMLFNDAPIGSDYSVHIDLGTPEAPIEAITIVSSNAVDWHLCHGIRISNTVKDVNVEKGSAIPSAGDNLVQLGYRGTDDDARQSAIIISAYESPDPDVIAPSYAQYMGINDFDLLSHRGSYMDANGAKFVGDITMCNVNGKSINDTINEQTELSNKKLLLSTSSCRIYRDANTPTQLVAVPSTYDISILVPTDGTIQTMTTVPEGYRVTVTYYDQNSNQIIGELNPPYNAGDSIHNISFRVGSELDTIGFIRVSLLKIKNGVEQSNWPVVDTKEITYIQGTVDVERWEFRYRNYTPTTANPVPQKPAAGTDGTTGGWTNSATTPDFANGEYTWMTQCRVIAEVYGTWSDPIRITGDNGQDGVDGKDIEYIYTTNNTGVAPSAPPLNQTDDWPRHEEGGQIIDHDTVDGVTWYDNPQGVSENNQYEYVSTRKKVGGSWHLYSTPVIWSKWGEKGQDGDGYEYIYKLTDEHDPTNIANPTPGDWDDTSSTYQNTDEYADQLVDWSDDPQTVSQNTRYLYVSVRKKQYYTSIDGTTYNRIMWGKFSTPSLWARYSEQGEAGGHYKFRYCNFTPTIGHTTPTKPTAGTNGIGTYGTGADAATWAEIVGTPDIENGEYTWMTQTYVTPNTSGDTYGTWENAIRITGGKGETGADGTDIEFIYTQNNTGTAPSAPPQNQTDDWPTGGSSTVDGVTWYDNPQGVSENNQYEYVSVRYKNDNVWTPYSTPVIWSKWGEKGQDGDGYEYIYALGDSAPNISLPSNWDNASSQYQKESEYAPYMTNWGDDPLTPTSTTGQTKCWVSYRKKQYYTSIEGTTYNRIMWGKFSTPALWSMYVVAEGAEPGADAEFNYLIPNRETFIAKYITSITDDTTCNLYIDLNYSLAHVKGSRASIINWADASLYTLQMNVYSANSSHLYTVNISNGEYTEANLLEQISSITQKDYMELYRTDTQHSVCPAYAEIILKLNGAVLDKRIIYVQLETGAVLKVTDDAITSAVASSKTYTDGVLNSDSFIQQTSDMISTEVTEQMAGYATTGDLSTYVKKSEFNQTADKISTRVSRTEDQLNHVDLTKSQLIDASSLDENKAYPVVIKFLKPDSNNVYDGSENIRCKVSRTLDSSYGVPSYSRHGNGFTVNLDWYTKASGWGTNIVNKYWVPSTQISEIGTKGDYTRYINDYDKNWLVDSTAKIVGSIQQNTEVSREIVYVRGGSKYNVETSHYDSTIDLYPSGYSWSHTDGSTYSYSAPIINVSDIVEPEIDRRAFGEVKSEIQQTADNIQLNVYDEINRKTGIDVSQGRITLKGEDTDVIGNLNVRGSGSGFQFTDDNGNVGLRIENSSVRNKDEFLQANFTHSFSGVKVYRNAMMGETDKMSIGIWKAGTISISYNYGYLLWRNNGTTSRPDGTGVSVYLKPSLWCIANNIYQRIGDPGTRTNTLLSSSGNFVNKIGGGSWTAPKQQEYFISYEWQVTGLTFKTSTDYYEFNYSFKYTPNTRHPHIDFNNNGLGIQFSHDIKNFFYTGYHETEISYSNSGASKFRVDDYGVHVGRRAIHCQYRSDATLEYIGDYYLEYNYPHQPSADPQEQQQWESDSYKNAFNFTNGGKHLIAGDYFRIFNLTGTLHRFRQLDDNTTNGVDFRIIKSNNNSLTDPSCAITNQSGTSVDIIIPKWSIMTGIWDGERFMCYFTFFN